jgi:hypothetical protein
MSAGKQVAQDETGYAVPALASFKVAAPHVGASSAAALRRRFERGLYPRRFVVQLTPRLPGVDLHGLIAWIRHRNSDTEALSTPTGDISST